MSLHDIVIKLSKQEAVNKFAEGSKNIVAIYNSESYSVDSYNIFDKDGVEFYHIDYQMVDVLKLIDYLTGNINGYEDVAKKLYENETFTSMKSTKYSIKGD